MSERERKRLRVWTGSADPVAEGEVLDRRRFLAMMAASAALAGAGGCTRQPAEEIVPYVRQPEGIVPGKSQYYATSMVHAGYATGLLVRSVTGRPIKVEGNPEHPASLGATDAFSQAQVLSLYDPGREQVVTRLGRITTWSRFASELAQAVNVQRAGGGAGIRILTGAVSSPSLAAEIAAFLGEFPAAKWCHYEAAGGHAGRAGAVMAYGVPLEARHDLSLADVVLTIESDLLAYGPGNLRHARDFALRRAPGSAAAMNRLYSVESSPTCTGTLADHRLPLRPSEAARFTAALAAELGVIARPGALPEALAKRAAVIAKDLRAHPGRSLIVAGEAAPPALHALTFAMNEALHNTGAAVTLIDPVEASPVDHIASIRELVEDMRAGRVALLVVLGCNPVYTAPADLDFAEALRHVPLSVRLSLHSDETSPLCHYNLPEAHLLESWGDARAFDGTVSFIQPLLDPLYSGKSAHQIVRAMRGQPAASGLELLRAHWRSRLGEGEQGGELRRALERGFLPGTAFEGRKLDIVAGAAQRAASEIAAAASGGGGYELAIRPDPTVDDGRFADNGWLQELPKPHTKLTWDNAAILGPGAAADLGVTNGDVVELAREGRSVTAPVYILAGHPDGVATVHLGYGGGRGGFDAYRLRTSAALWHGNGLSIRKTGERRNLAVAQSHFNPEGRRHVRVTTLEELRRHPEIIREMDEPDHASLYDAWKYEGRQWGMSIDTGACTGCSACVVACQAENNIPVIGKEQIEAGRAMHWLRIDRYEIGGGPSPLVVHQPMMCVHCETAPCEYVCPVGATTHSADGLNEMTYNRCVGTRYCSNNCPYKVRHFNFLQYSDMQAGVKRLLPNPDVTVRSRGVMEKCTYCVQRIRTAEIDAEREGRELRDGEVVTACQAACPTGAIVFGDIHAASRVRALKEDPRSYGVLAELNTHPRTTHLARVRNPNPELEEHV